MGLYVYCVVPAGTAPPAGVAGIGSSAVTDFDAGGGCALWLSQVERAPAASVEAVRAHHAVIERAMGEGVTPVPLRFGQWAPDDDALRRSAAEKLAEWRAALADFAGMAEFGVRVVDPALASARNVRPSTTTSGRAYLEALVANRSERGRRDVVGRDIAERIAAALGPLARATRVEPLGTAHGVVSVAHLIARADEDSYRARVAEVRAGLTSFRFLVSGPWPPYSFAT